MWPAGSPRAKLPQHCPRQAATQRRQRVHSCACMPMQRGSADTLPCRTMAPLPAPQSSAAQQPHRFALLCVWWSQAALTEAQGRRSRWA